MNTQAILKYQKISAQKCRLVADAVRGLPVNKAFEFLNYSNKKASQLILKVLESAVANAEHNNSSDLDELVVKNVLVDEGPYGKRHRPRARGRVNQILKGKTRRYFGTGLWVQDVSLCLTIGVQPMRITY